MQHTRPRKPPDQARPAPVPYGVARKGVVHTGPLPASAARRGYHAGTPRRDEAGEAPLPLLDIARVVPYPADFGDLVPGIGFVDGRFSTLDEDARRAAAAAAAAVGEDSTATMPGANR